MNVSRHSESEPLFRNGTLDVSDRRTSRMRHENRAKTPPDSGDRCAGGCDMPGSGFHLSGTSFLLRRVFFFAYNSQDLYPSGTTCMSNSHSNLAAFGFVDIETARKPVGRWIASFQSGSQPNWGCHGGSLHQGAVSSHRHRHLGFLNSGYEQEWF